MRYKVLKDWKQISIHSISIKKKMLFQSYIYSDNKYKLCQRAVIVWTIYCRSCMGEYRMTLFLCTKQKPFIVKTAHSLPAFFPLFCVRKWPRTELLKVENGAWVSCANQIREQELIIVLSQCESRACSSCLVSNLGLVLRPRAVSSLSGLHITLPGADTPLPEMTSTSAASLSFLRFICRHISRIQFCPDAPLEILKDFWLVSQSAQYGQ